MIQTTATSDVPRRPQRAVADGDEPRATPDQSLLHRTHVRYGAAALDAYADRPGPDTSP
ncbi:hypothetical protein ABT160_07765 [Streptomyces sp. NPDC001941]|uniref:hypothetical protein n=1 Tax=Streptomyces sp. NPDC001941 TaxID=3154659 RepID=UPI00331BB3EC